LLTKLDLNIAAAQKRKKAAKLAAAMVEEAETGLGLGHTTPIDATSARIDPKTIRAKTTQGPSIP
jgi:hypothetical protein